MKTNPTQCFTKKNEFGFALFGGVKRAKSEPKEFGFACFGGPEGIRTLDLSDANELKALICIDFQTFPALSAGM